MNRLNVGFGEKKSEKLLLKIKSGTPCSDETRFRSEPEKE